YRAFRTHVAAALAERMADVGHGAHAVVGQAVHDHGHATGRIALVADLFVLDAFQLTGRLLDGALDHILGHVRGQALVHGHAQARVVVGVASTAARGNADLADDLGENLAALRVRRVFAVLDGGASTHGVTLVLLSG